MYRRLWLSVGLSVLGVVGGIGLVAYAESPAAVVTSTAVPSVRMATSSTTLQSFLWMYDPHGQKIIFCYSAAEPATGPQYDFRCRERGVSEALSP